MLLEATLDNLLLAIRESVDALDKPKVGSADERNLSEIGRCSQMVQYHKLKIFLQHIAVKTAFPGYGRREETANVSYVNHIS